jgi:hypothetical protein
MDLCVNQMGKTQTNPLAARHGRGTASARHAMCESALRKAAIASMPTRVSRMYFLYTKVHHSLADNLQLFKAMQNGPIPVAAQSKTWGCGRSLAGVVNSNPASGIDVSLLRLLCVVR